jgi:hypothetical protein
MSSLIGVTEIKEMIIEFRRQKVILDRDVAVLYGIPTRALIQAVKRNRGRFPHDFMFQLNDNERDFLVSQNVIPKHIKYLGGRNPYVFTRNGANMLSAVLRSPIAVKRSIQIMRAFSALEEMMSRQNKLVSGSPMVLDKLSTHSRAIMHLFQRDKVNTKEVAKVRKIVNEMIEALQQMVFKRNA